MNEDYDELSSEIKELKELVKSLSEPVNQLHKKIKPIKEELANVESYFSNRISAKFGVALGKSVSGAGDFRTNLLKLSYDFGSEILKKSDLFSGMRKILGDFFAGTRATGGNVGSYNPYIVGERGPELFIPHQSGYIRPKLGNQNITVNVFNNKEQKSNFKFTKKQVLDQICRGLVM